MTSGYDVAKQHIGLQEHRDKDKLMELFKEQKIMDPNNPKVPFNPDGSVKGGLPWCAAFVSFCERTAGNNCSVRYAARNFLDYGTNAGETIKDLLKAKEGDIIVFTRGNNGYSGHVAYFVSYDPKTNLVKTLGGNQSDAVSYAFYAASKLLGIRRP